MKCIRFRIVVLLWILIHGCYAFAYDVAINGIYYNLNENDKTAEVTSGDDLYYGEINIPERIAYNNQNYYVRSIGYRAFYRCWDLEAITFPKYLNTIGNQAFSGCESLTSLTIPDHIYSIEIDAFDFCTSLSSIRVGEGNPRYDSRDNCNAIIETVSNTLIIGCEKTKIPNSVTSIDSRAFYKCTNLTALTIPNSVTSIGDISFAECNGLTSITIPSSVISIGSSAFYGCNNLIVVKSEIADPFIISESVFYKISPDARLVVPKGTIEKYKSFSGWTKNFKEIVEFNDDNSSVISFADANVKAICIANWDTNGDCEISEEEATAVKDIGSAFKGNSKITSFDEFRYFGVTSLSDTFRDCIGLTSISLPGCITSIGEFAFSGCSSLSSITIPNGVNSIGYAAFSGCSKIVTITIPKSVSSISEDVFEGCGNLESISVDSENAVYDSRDKCNAIIETKSNTLVSGCNNTIIPNSVTSIGNLAFLGCTLLTSVTIPNSVTSIGNSAFSYCTNLTSITIPNSVTNIGGGAFRNCQGLTSVTIPKSVTSIGEGAFEWCSYLTSLIVESGNTVYDSRNNCNAIIETKSNTLIAGCNNTIIPNSVIKIGKCAFFGCKLLTNITIPNGVTTIELGAFWDCYELSSLTISSSVTSISPYAFCDCKKLIVVKSWIVEPFAIDNSVFSGISSGARLEVPYGTKEKYQALSGWKNFKEIVEVDISSPIISFADPNVKAICVANWDTDGDGELSEDEARAVKDLGTVFEDNRQISSFDELCYFGVNSVSELAFCGCDRLSSVTIPLNVVAIERGAFSGCLRLTSVIIPNNVTSIGEGAFAYSGINYVIIPKQVTIIGEDVFYSCSKLSSIIVDSSNPVYDSRDNCNALIRTKDNILKAGCKNTTIPNSVTSISDKAFYSCKGLTGIIIPNGVTSIGAYSFSECTNLTTVTIPNSMTSIGRGAFLNCSMLTSVTIPNSVNHIEELVFHYTGWYNNQPDGLLYLSNCLLGYKENVPKDSVYIKEGTRLISYRAFSGCTGLTSVTIPNSVNAIDYYAFSGCNRLTSIISQIEIPFEISEGVFPDYSKPTLTVPSGTKAAYQATKYWNKFENIVEKEPEVIKGDISGDGIVNVSDIVAVVNYILGKATEDFDESVVDMNGDGIVNVTDVVMMVSIIMSGQYDAARSTMEMTEAATDNDWLTLIENGDHSLSLRLENEGGYIAAQFEVRIDEGMTLESITLNDQRSGDHLLKYTKTGDNIYKVIVYSVSNNAFGGHDGELLSIRTKGSGNVTLDNILFVTDGQKEKRFTPLYDNTTGIETIQPSTLNIQNSYDLQGRKVENVQLKKGVYIKNGKKQVVR